MFRDFCRIGYTRFDPHSHHSTDETTANRLPGINEIVDKLSRILNIKGIINPEKSEILAALVKYEHYNADIVDCMLAAKSSHHRIIVPFDKDFKRLKAICETL